MEGLQCFRMLLLDEHDITLHGALSLEGHGPGQLQRGGRCHPDARCLVLETCQQRKVELSVLKSLKQIVNVMLISH